MAFASPAIKPNTEPEYIFCFLIDNDYHIHIEFVDEYETQRTLRNSLCSPKKYILLEIAEEVYPVL